MKVDLKRELPSYAARRGRFDVVTVPSMAFLMIDGHGDPNTSTAWSDALETIYPVAYALKFASRATLDRDYVVMPLEALWWSDDMDAFTRDRDKSRWSWTALMVVPDWLTAHHVEAAIEQTRRKGRGPALDALRFDRFDEGLAVQTLHVGPYDHEGPILAELHDSVIPAHGLRMSGRHHEIYLSDARRTAPEKLRTILRQPAEPGVT